jgi:hypothetical protein
LKTCHILGSGIAVLCILLLGCQSPPVAPRKETTITESTRNNAYSLLHQLMAQEKDVSMLRFIKREHADLKELIKKVAAACGEGAEKMEAFAKRDSSLALDDFGLPPGEQKTRDDIGAKKQSELLHESGDQFEVTLLLTQVEALNYGQHLAKIASENDFQPERARYLMELSSELGALRDQVVSLLTVKARTPPVERTK